MPSRDYDQAAARLALAAAVAGIAGLILAFTAVARPDWGGRLPGIDLAPWLLGIAALLAPLAFGLVAIGLGLATTRRLVDADGVGDDRQRAGLAVALGADVVLGAVGAAVLWYPQLDVACQARARSMAGRGNGDVVARAAHADLAVRKAAIRALAERPASVGATTLIGALRDADVEADARWALRALGATAAPPLVVALGARDVPLAEAAREGLRTIAARSAPDSEAVVEALRLAGRHRDPRVRRAAVWVSADYPERQLAVLEESWQDSDPSVRLAAALTGLAADRGTVVGWAYDSGAVDLATQPRPDPVALAAGEPEEIQRTVFTALHRTSVTPDARDAAFRRGLLDRRTRRAALAVLASHGDVRALPEALPVCLHDSRTRGTTAHLVSSSGPNRRAMLPDLLATLTRTGWGLAESVSVAPPATSPSCGHRDGDACVAEALGGLAWPEDVSVIEPLLDDPDAERRIRALAAMLRAARFGNLRDLVCARLVQALRLPAPHGVLAARVLARYAPYSQWLTIDLLDLDADPAAPAATRRLAQTLVAFQAASPEACPGLDERLRLVAVAAQ